MSNASWFAQKIAQRQGLQPPPPQMFQPQALVPSQTYQPAVYPGQQGFQPQPGYPQPQPMAPGYPYQQPQPQLTPDGKIDAISAVSVWQGTKQVARERHLRCPHCDSQLLMSQTNGGAGLVNTHGDMVRPSAWCGDCGWSEAVPLQYGAITPATGGSPS